MRHDAASFFPRRGWLVPATALAFLFAGPAADSTPPAALAAAPERTATAAAPEPQQRRRPPARPRGQQAPTPERIKEIQAALAERGFYPGEPSGRWDEKSQEAMKAFQEANNLRPTGRIDALSLQALGLGSEIAGVAPPRPRAGEAGEAAAPAPDPR